MKIMGSNQYSNCPEYISNDLLNEDWAFKIHSQSLERLNQRGGMSPFEIYLNVNKIKYRECKEIDPEFDDKQAVVWLRNFLDLDKAISNIGNDGGTDIMGVNER